jgi:hypothetical protein
MLDNRLSPQVASGHMGRITKKRVSPVRKYRREENRSPDLAKDLETYRLVKNHLTFQQLAERIAEWCKTEPSVQGPGGIPSIHFTTLIRAEDGCRLRKRTAFLLRKFLEAQAQG